MKEITLIFSSILWLASMVCCNHSESINDSELKERKQLYPPDSELSDESLIDFLAQLDKAIDEKDTNFIYAHIDSNIHLSFGGHVGFDDFKDVWKITDTDTRFWTEMRKIRNLGGEMIDSFYYSPYVSSRWREVAEDAFTHMAVIDSNVYLYENANTDSKVILALDYEIVKNLELHNNHDGWRNVETLDKKYSGFIKEEKLRSPNDYRIMIKKFGDIWKIETLIAGD